LRGAFGFAVFGACGCLGAAFLGAVFLAGATDLTTASVAATETGVGSTAGAGVSTLYGTSATGSAGLLPNSFLINDNIKNLLVSLFMVKYYYGI
jgi:hypothetical protein